jgi:argonaute-like protein implicated in RNA metabolism and viral defense
MVDTPTLVNPDWKDLNLALNITAKCGVTPWVLPDAIPSADFFVGLSYTQSEDGQRVMGFANVFSKYGKWEFYSGNTTTFDYREKSKRFAELINATLTRLSSSLSATPNVVFHYSARFSREDRESILEAARKIRPQGTYTFVWINTHHNVRIFDSRAETDGSVRRGSYVKTSPSQVFLSTTGYNPFRKAMGTPKAVQINVEIAQPVGKPAAEPDLKSVALQVLSLTKLNWASTDSFSGEPITTKYAGNIAYLTAAFLRQSKTFNLHPILENTPWFL